MTWHCTCMHIYLMIMYNHVYVHVHVHVDYAYAACAYARPDMPCARCARTGTSTPPARRVHTAYIYMYMYVRTYAYDGGGSTLERGRGGSSLPCTHAQEVTQSVLRACRSPRARALISMLSLLNCFQK